MKRIMIAAAAFGLVMTGYTAGLAREHQAQPSCPNEDSCVADYVGGPNAHWIIREVTP